MKPTEEQIKKFWEWCGLQHFPEIIEGGHIERLSYWSYHGRDVTEYLGSPPEIDLNNLFKWAVPAVLKHFKDLRDNDWMLTKEGKLAFAIRDLKDFLKDWIDEFTDDPEKNTLALFWAIWKVMEEK